MLEGKSINSQPIKRSKAASEPFFLIKGAILTAIILFGFIPPLLSKPNGAFSLPLLYHLHGMVILSWFSLFTLQAYLVRGRNLELHRRFGQSSVIIAAAMLMTGYFMMRAA